MEKRIALPLTDAIIDDLRAGDKVLLSGDLVVARDAAHQRWADALKIGEKLPVDLQGSTVYYMGPSPARPGQIIGACGPTTAGRMDAYTPDLLARGLKGMIGKGRRSPAVLEAIRAHHAVYFAAVGGCGALLARTVVACEPLCYEDLGAEAVLRLTVRDFPCIVAADAFGGNLYR